MDIEERHHGFDIEEKTSRLRHRGKDITGFDIQEVTSLAATSRKRHHGFDIEETASRFRHRGNDITGKTSGGSGNRSGNDMD